MPLPDFLVIGAAHAGTTSLHAYLRQHSGIFVPTLKEPSFFALDPGERLAGPGSEWLRDTCCPRREDYEELFRDALPTQVRGEVSPRYLTTPSAARRIQHLIPEARIIAVLRHPVDCAYSTFLHRRREGWEPCADLASAITDEPRRRAEGWSMGLLRSAGLYAEHLARYFERFPREQIRVHLFEDFRRSPREVMTDIFDFLEVDPGVAIDTSRRHNRSGTIRHPLLRVLWRRSYRLRRRLRPWLPERWRDWAYRRVHRDLVRPALAAETRRQLLESYRSDIESLQELLERNLSSWLERPGVLPLAATGSRWGSSAGENPAGARTTTMEEVSS